MTTTERETVSRHSAPTTSDQRDLVGEAMAALAGARTAVEGARQHAYEHHRLAGEADAGLLSAVRLLRVAGQHELADVILGQLVGRSVAEDRWTFEVDETHDDDFFRTLQDVEDRLHARAPTDGPD